MKLVMLLVTVIAITSCSGCSCTGERDRPPTVRTAEPTEVIGQDLMVALQRAKNFHHLARVHQSNGETDQAVAAVREILSIRFPAGAPEAEDVRNDARALLAKLLISQGAGKVEEAMNVVNEGIAQSQRESFFVANLYTAKGEIHEARAALLEGNDPANAQKIKDEKHAAIDAFTKSNDINAELQRRLMEER